MSCVKLLDAMSGIIIMKTHLKGVLSCSGILDPYFLFIVHILHDIQKGSGSTLGSIYCQTFAVSLSSGNLADLCPNIWCNNYKEIFFLGV